MSVSPKAAQGTARAPSAPSSSPSRRPSKLRDVDIALADVLSLTISSLLLQQPKTRKGWERAMKHLGDQYRKRSMHDAADAIAYIRRASLDSTARIEAIVAMLKPPKGSA